MGDSDSQQSSKIIEKNGTGANKTVESSPQARKELTHSNSLILAEDESAYIEDTSGGNPNQSEVSLPESVLEKLFQSYSIKQRRAGLDWFLVSSILFDAWAIAVPQGQSYAAIGITGIALTINACILVVLRVMGDGKLQKTIWEIVPHVVWLLAIVQLFLYLLFKTPVTTRDLLGWGILLNFLVYVTLPVPLLYTGILYGIGTFTIFMSSLIGLAKKELYFWEQQSANAILTLAAAIIGLLYYFLGEAKHRQAFLEARKSLEVKMVMEEQSAEEERLLLSVLPEHVAVKMRQDLGSRNSEQFKKIYMSRHENVSILYADIVGFTAISSTYSAQDLVKMLNELFARFDRLAEKYQQLRIKILGDCYYCISGAPVERPDHAVLCVHMGLSMVKAIKYVQQKTNSPVDMRVGIHTGAILAGVLGQRQWQFDVYSKDVELANKMESSGKAGRVHISEKTLSFLSGEFEVEPAFGEKREEALRIAGLKTYFITKVVIPFAPASSQKENGTTRKSSGCDGDTNSTEILPDNDSKACSGDEEANVGMDDRKEEDFKQRLRKELVSRDGHGDLSKDTTIFLTFKNPELEKYYTVQRERYSSIPLIASLLVQIICVIYSSLILPRTAVHYAIILTTLVMIAILVFVSVAESFSNIFSWFFVNLSENFNNISLLRRSSAIIIIILVGSSNLTDMYYLANMKVSNLEETIQNYTTSTETAPTFFTDAALSMDILQFPSYMSNYCVLILIAVAVIAQLTHICKIFFMILITVLHFIMNICPLSDRYNNEEQQYWNTGLSLKYNVSAILFVVAVSLSFFARHMDKEDRIIFKWKSEVADQKEKAADMRRRNAALVYNVLPYYVAEHFIKNRKRSHDDLYSQSYAEVGVLFASMPNFTDFYSEETVNNQGLECLRFLNEVISDYDALLSLPQFQDIIKIKTIGSTYMAASGLNLSRPVNPNDPVIVRWKHLSLLVDFALELKKVLQEINEQSFNHFVLKMGINHGPITAGVIGARKPHYDIWGNTVNVASRMESTGKAGAIQVTEETCQILQTFGYTFEQRGLVAVKGKGQLMTYYLQGKSVRPNPPTSPMLSTVNTMETLPEVEEPCESLNALQNANANKVTHNSATASPQLKDGTSSSDTRKVNITLPTGGTPLKGQLIIDTSLSEITRAEVFDDPRSPKNSNTFVLNSLTANSFNRADHKTNAKHNGIDNTELDVDIDAKTPLLNLNSTNLESARDFSASEEDSLIKKE